jgi:hypothetical protein
MADEKTPIEQALELFVFAPLGLALTAQENLPQLIEKGRQRVQGQVTMARMVGEFAAKEAQRQAEAQVRKVTETLSSARPAAPPTPPPPSPASTPNPAPAAPAATSTSSANGRSNGKAKAKPAASAASLAIPNYDALSASQVVQRLSGLSAGELDAVRVYEEATRGRRTILAKAAQLQAEATS